MVDLETMSLAKDAAIVSIGAVRFDLATGFMADRFYRVVNLKSSQRAGGKIDAETVMWWLEQSTEARKALTGDDGVLIETALIEFSAWCRQASFDGLWGNGAAFDNVVLDGAYKRLSKTSPWTHKQDRCYRTIKALFKHVPEEQMKGTAHNALDDARHQAEHLCKIWKVMNA